MTKEEAKQIFLSRGYVEVEGVTIYDPDKWREACVVISDWLEQEPCEDAISRQAAIDAINTAWTIDDLDNLTNAMLTDTVKSLPFVTPQLKTGYCKDCKYFEYDSVAKVDGIPIIVAHEFCKRWGDGCKTKEDGYCFLYEPKESEEE